MKTSLIATLLLGPMVAVADDTADSLVITVTGEAGIEIRWVANVETVEVTVP